MLTAVEERPTASRAALLDSHPPEAVEVSATLPDRLYVKRREIDGTIAEAVRLIDAGDLTAAAELKDGWFLAVDFGPFAGEPFLLLTNALESAADSAYQAGWTFEEYASYCTGVTWHTHVLGSHELKVLQVGPEALRAAWNKAKEFVRDRPASGASESDRTFLATWLDAVENWPGFDPKRRANVLKVAFAIALLVWTLGKRALELSQRALAQSAVTGRQAAASSLKELHRCGFLNVKPAGNRPSTIRPVLPEGISQLRTIRPLIKGSTNCSPQGKGRMALSCEDRLPVHFDEPIWVLRGLRGNGYWAYTALSDTIFEEPKTIQMRMGGGDVYRHLGALEVAGLALVERHGKRKRYMRNPTPSRTLPAWDEARAITGKRADRSNLESETFAAESMVRHELELEEAWRSNYGVGVRPVAVVDPYHDIDHVTRSLITSGKGWQLAHAVRDETWWPAPELVAQVLMCVSRLKTDWEQEQALKRRTRVARLGGKPTPPGRVGPSQAICDDLVSLHNLHLHVHWASLGGAGDPPIMAVSWDKFVDVETDEVMPALAGYRLLEMYAAESRAKPASHALVPSTQVFVSEPTATEPDLVRS